jgi:hypothetical protein
MRLFLYFSMMGLRSSFVVFFLSALLGCGDGGSGASKESAAVNTKDSAEKKVGEMIFIPANIQGEVDILYFKKPFTDSVRYTRYYRVAQTTDTVFFAALSAALQQHFEHLDAPRKCLSEGKIQVSLGGDAFKVVYFSRKETGCSYLYVIRDGMFYYFDMPEHLNRFLIELEKQSKEI